MTKILHVSDTHLGLRQYRSNVRRSDFADAFDAAVDIAIDEDVDAVIHTGDLFDDPSPNVPTVNRCLDAVSRLESEDIPFLAIVGNHERKRDEQWMDIIKRFGNTVRLSASPTLVAEEGGTNPVNVFGFDAVRNPAWDSYDFSLEEPEDEDAANLLCMHELFEPLVPPHRGDPYHLDEFLDRLNFLPDGLALGDFHSTCNTDVNGVKAFYPGATERTKVSESSAPCVYVLEVSDGDIQLRTRTIESAGRENVPRDFLVVNVEFEEGHGIEHVERRIDEEAGGEDIAEKVVAVRLRGVDVPVTTNDVYSLLSQREVPVPNVDDKRQVDADFDFNFDEEDTDDIDQMIEEQLSDLSLSPLSAEAEDLVRDDSIDDDDIRTEMNHRIRAAQEAEFGEATLEER
jgi:DNA repair exonuclease SbcCD nuclease subunit